MGAPATREADHSNEARPSPLVYLPWRYAPGTWYADGFDALVMPVLGGETFATQLSSTISFDLVAFRREDLPRGTRDSPAASPFAPPTSVGKPSRSP
jgi:hypothetical protein